MSKVTRSVVLDGYGDVDRLRFAEDPLPAPGDGEVLVEVVSAGVSHMDGFVRQGQFAREIPFQFPAPQGVSFAGIVRAVGPKVSGLHARAEVIGHAPRHDAWSSHVVVPRGAIVPKPAQLDFGVAGALYLVGCTAYRIVQSLGITERDTVVISAAAGGVGHIECQLARLAGAEVIGIAGADNADYLRSLGVKPVRHGDGLAERIREAVPGRAATVFIDNYGGYEELALELRVSPQRTATSGRRRETEVRLYADAGEDPRIRQDLADVAELLGSWGIRVLVSGFYSFDDLPQATADLGALHSRGVVVVGMHTAADRGEYTRQKLRSRYEQSAG